MKQIFNLLRTSLKLRVIVFTLTVFTVSVLIFSTYFNYMLRQSMHQLLGDQQVATVSSVASEINANLDVRLKALELIANGIDSSLISKPAALQTYIEQKPLLTLLFNAGAFIVNANGDGVADIPRIGRVGINYLDRDHIAAALTQGKAIVGKAVIGKKVKSPSFAITVPIKDVQGNVIGALAGATDLSKPNFLTEFTNSTYGKTGGFVILDSKHQLIVTATASGMYGDLVMRPLPSREVNPLMYKRIDDGFDGTAVNHNSLGVEVMTSSARLPFPDWILIASLPTAEAFAPIVRAQSGVLVSSILIILIAGGLMWLFMTRLLRREFAPILIASKEIRRFTDTDLVPQLLPVTKHDEVGLLIESFNRLLGVLSEREKRVRVMFEEASDGIHLLDLQGNIVQCSPSFAKILGYTKEEIININVRNLDVKLPSDEISNILAELTIKPTIIESVLRRKDGALIDAQINIKRIQLDGNGYIYGSVRDITQQKQDRYQLELLATCMGHTNDVVVITEAEPFELPGPRIVYVNEAFERLTGYTSKEAIGNSPRMLQGPKTDPVTMHQIRDALSQWKSVRVEMLNYTKDGREFWVELDISPIADVNGWYTHWISIQRDITERKMAIEQIRKLSLAVDQSLESVIVTDLEGRIEYVNEGFVQSTGYNREEVIGKNPRILQSGKTPQETYQSLWTALREGKSWKGELINRRKDGSEYTEQASISPIRDDAGNITHYLASKEDVTEKRAAEVRTHHLAFYDQLTDLPNRLLLLDRLRLSLKTSHRSKQYGAILFIDLDNFKMLNDTLGHDAGDELLKEVATRLLFCVRENDTVSRFGGDEFVMMLEGLSTDTLEAAAITETIAKKVIEVFDGEFTIGSNIIRSSPSIGITLFSGHHGDNIEEVLKQSDLAMYAAKTAGRNAYRFFDQTMQSSVNARAVIEKDLRAALDQSRFCLHYQPQLNKEGHIIGAEALVRMNHSERGLIAPGEFIQVAEQTGLIVPLGEWILQAACEQLVMWENDPDLVGLALSVNVSAGQFRDPNFVGKVLDTLERTGANPQLLKLEPTESLSFEDVNETIHKMTLLRTKGVHFALDDFGTGYSSLSYLKKLPLDQLKIDQSFVRDLPQDPHACSIVRAIITLAKSLELGIIAEGVETKEQREFLLKNGCEFFQGYLFSRPIPLEEFNQFVKSNQVKTV